MGLHTLSFHAIILTQAAASMSPHAFPAAMRFEDHASSRKIFCCHAAVAMLIPDGTILEWTCLFSVEDEVLVS